jgi:hypothetical protein
LAKKMKLQDKLMKLVKKTPGQRLKDFVLGKMLPSENLSEKDCYQQLLIVAHGSVYEDFAHAFCFVRKDLGQCKQVQLLDPKNTKPIFCARLSAEQELLHLSLKLKEDIDDDCYNRWDIYYLEKRQAKDH